MKLKRGYKKMSEVEKKCKSIAEKYKTKNIKYVFGVTTGGVVPGFLVAKYMRKQHLYRNLRVDKSFDQSVAVHPKTNILVIDDIEDSGATKKKIKKLLPNCFFESVFRKKGKGWLIMPWETNQDNPNERQQKL